MSSSGGEQWSSSSSSFTTEDCGMVIRNHVRRASPNRTGPSSVHLTGMRPARHPSPIPGGPSSTPGAPKPGPGLGPPSTLGRRSGISFVSPVRNNPLFLVKPGGTPQADPQGPFKPALPSITGGPLPRQGQAADAEGAKKATGAPTLGSRGGAGVPRGHQGSVVNSVARRRTNWLTGFRGKEQGNSTGGVPTAGTGLAPGGASTSNAVNSTGNGMANGAVKKPFGIGRSASMDLLSNPFPPKVTNGANSTNSTISSSLVNGCAGTGANGASGSSPALDLLSNPFPHQATSPGSSTLSSTLTSSTFSKSPASSISSPFPSPAQEEQAGTRGSQAAGDELLEAARLSRRAIEGVGGPGAGALEPPYTSGTPFNPGAFSQGSSKKPRASSVPRDWGTVPPASGTPPSQRDWPFGAPPASSGTPSAPGAPVTPGVPRASGGVPSFSGIHEGGIPSLFPMGPAPMSTLGLRYPSSTKGSLGPLEAPPLQPSSVWEVQKEAAAKKAEKHVLSQVALSSVLSATASAAPQGQALNHRDRGVSSSSNINSNSNSHTDGVDGVSDSGRGSHDNLGSGGPSLKIHGSIERRGQGSPLQTMLTSGSASPSTLPQDPVYKGALVAGSAAPTLALLAAPWAHHRKHSGVPAGVATGPLARSLSQPRHQRAPESPRSVASLPRRPLAPLRGQSSPMARRQKGAAPSEASDPGSPRSVVGSVTGSVTATGSVTGSVADPSPHQPWGSSGDTTPGSVVYTSHLPGVHHFLEEGLADHPLRHLGAEGVPLGYLGSEGVPEGSQVGTPGLHRGGDGTPGGYFGTPGASSGTQTPLQGLGLGQGMGLGVCEGWGDLGWWSGSGEIAMSTGDLSGTQGVPMKQAQMLEDDACSSQARAPKEEAGSGTPGAHGKAQGEASQAQEHTSLGSSYASLDASSAMRGGGYKKEEVARLRAQLKRRDEILVGMQDVFAKFSSEVASLKEQLREAKLQNGAQTGAGGGGGGVQAGAGARGGGEAQAVGAWDELASLRRALLEASAARASMRGEIDRLQVELAEEAAARRRLQAEKEESEKSSDSVSVGGSVGARGSAELEAAARVHLGLRAEVESLKRALDEEVEAHHRLREENEELKARGGPERKGGPERRGEGSEDEGSSSFLGDAASKWLRGPESPSAKALSGGVVEGSGSVVEAEGEGKEEGKEGPEGEDGKGGEGTWLSKAQMDDVRGLLTECRVLKEEKERGEEALRQALEEGRVLKQEKAGGEEALRQALEECARLKAEKAEGAVALEQALGECHALKQAKSEVELALKEATEEGERGLQQALAECCVLRGEKDQGEEALQRAVAECRLLKEDKRKAEEALQQALGECWEMREGKSSAEKEAQQALSDCWVLAEEKRKGEEALAQALKECRELREAQAKAEEDAQQALAECRALAEGRREGEVALRLAREECERLKQEKAEGSLALQQALDDCRVLTQQKREAEQALEEATAERRVLADEKREQELALGQALEECRELREARAKAEDEVREVVAECCSEKEARGKAEEALKQALEECEQLKKEGDASQEALRQVLLECSTLRSKEARGEQALQPAMQDGHVLEKEKRLTDEAPQCSRSQGQAAPQRGQGLLAPSHGRPRALFRDLATEDTSSSGVPGAPRGTVPLPGAPLSSSGQGASHSGAVAGASQGQSRALPREQGGVAKDWVSMSPVRSLVHPEGALGKVQAARLDEGSGVEEPASLDGVASGEGMTSPSLDASPGSSLDGYASPEASLDDSLDGFASLADEAVPGSFAAAGSSAGAAAPAQAADLLERSCGQAEADGFEGFSPETGGTEREEEFGTPRAEFRGALDLLAWRVSSRELHDEEEEEEEGEEGEGGGEEEEGEDEEEEEEQEKMRAESEIRRLLTMMSPGDSSAGEGSDGGPSAQGAPEVPLRNPSKGGSTDIEGSIAGASQPRAGQQGGARAAGKKRGAGGVQRGWPLGAGRRGEGCEGASEISAASQVVEEEAMEDLISGMKNFAIGGTGSSKRRVTNGFGIKTYK